MSNKISRKQEAIAKAVEGVWKYGVDEHRSWNVGYFERTSVPVIAQKMALEHYRRNKNEEPNKMLARGNFLFRIMKAKFETIG